MRPAPGSRWRSSATGQRTRSPPAAGIGGAGAGGPRVQERRPLHRRRRGLAATAGPPPDHGSPGAGAGSQRARAAARASARSSAADSITKLAVGGAVVALATAGAVTVHNREAHASPRRIRPRTGRTSPFGGADMGGRNRQRTRSPTPAAPGSGSPDLARARQATAGTAGPTSPASLTEPSGLGSADALLTSTGSPRAERGDARQPGPTGGERHRTGSRARGRSGEHSGRPRPAPRDALTPSGPSSAARPSSAGERSCGAGRCYAASALARRRARRQALKRKQPPCQARCPNRRDAGAGAYPASQR